MCYSGVITCNFCGTTSEELKKQKKAFYSDLFCSKKCRYARALMASQRARGCLYGIGSDAQSSASQNALSHRQLAVALKVSPARISQLIKSGMPHHSISAAKEWRTHNNRKTGPKQTIPCRPNDRSSDEAAVALDEDASDHSDRDERGESRLHAPREVSRARSGRRCWRDVGRAIGVG